MLIAKLIQLSKYKKPLDKNSLLPIGNFKLD
jgi:hypothetical protein